MNWVVAWWRRFWFDPSSPTNLGVSRCVFFALLFAIYVARDSSAWAEVPRAMWAPIPLFQILHLSVAPAEVLRILDWIWKGSLVLSCIGLRTRVSTAVAFALGFYLLGLPHNFGKIHHSTGMVVLILGILAAARSGDGWSCDRLLRSVRRDKEQHLHRASGLDAEYTWPVRLVWVVIALALFAAGVSKMRASGLSWITTENMELTLIAHQYTHRPATSWGLWVAAHHWLSRALAAGSVVLELSAPVALVSRRARLVIIPGLLGMQLGIWAVLGVSFASFMTAYVFWVPWDEIGHWIALRLRRKGKFVVLYDGACGVCRKTIGLLDSLNVADRVEFVDVVANWAEIERRFPELQQRPCLEDMHVITPAGKPMRGFYGYRALAKALPLGWPLLPLLYLPGVPYVGRHVYKAVADNRLRHGCPISS